VGINAPLEKRFASFCKMNNDGLLEKFTKDNFIALDDHVILEILE